MADPHAGSYGQRLEARRVEASAAVVAGSLDLLVLDRGEVFEFDIASEPTVNLPAADIRVVERICFVYLPGRRFGETAPSHVLCKRPDFPRDLVHLCASGPGDLAAPCLALGGLQPLYERAGIEALLERLRKFLRDAKTGSLTTGGWEPVPFAVEQAPCLGEVVPHFFQDHAFSNLQDGRAVGVAVNIEEDGERFVAVFPQIIQPAAMTDALAFRNEAGKRRGIPWVFVWPTDTTPASDPIFGDWRNGAELRAGMERMGVEHAFDATLGDLLGRGIDFRCYRPGLGGKGLVVVLGVWRPEPIMDEFFGYSQDREARRLELRAFRISQDWDKSVVDPDARVETIVGDYPGSPELYGWVSGVDALPPVTLIGAGAMGSAVYNHLVRSGLRDSLVVDNDRLRPHNLARHTGSTATLYQTKGDAASALVHSLVREMSLNFRAFNEDVTGMPMAELIGMTEGRLVIDATADERVRIRMDELRQRTPVTVVRCEMFHEGRLGVTFVSPPDGPGLADMMRMLMASATEEPSVAAWLRHEDMHPLGPDPLLAGFGCTSQTIHLPLHAVDQHASMATSTLIGDRGQAGIAINPVDDRYRPTGWRWLPVEPFQILTPPTEKEWKIRMSSPAVRVMSDARNAALPAETGGYLYGAWDPSAKEITVTTATTLPPGSTGTSTSLQLGPAGVTPEERRLLLKARGRIHLVGTWHSHPDDSGALSGRDYRTMMDHHARDVETLSPTLVVIMADGDVQAHLKLP